MLYGYARVSTEGQSAEAQIEELKGAGCSEVLAETASGARSDRQVLRKLISSLKAEDLLVVTRLDRLARSTRDLLNILADIGDKGAHFRSLHDPWADTTSHHGRLMLTVLGGLAEFERELIRVRTGEGRRRAKAMGRSLGRPFKLTQHQRMEAMARRDAGESISDIARSFNVSPSTVSRILFKRIEPFWTDIDARQKAAPTTSCANKDDVG